MIAATLTLISSAKKWSFIVVVHSPSRYGGIIVHTYVHKLWKTCGICPDNSWIWITVYHKEGHYFRNSQQVEKICEGDSKWGRDSSQKLKFLSLLEMGLLAGQTVDWNFVKVYWILLTVSWIKLHVGAHRLVALGELNLESWIFVVVVICRQEQWKKFKTINGHPQLDVGSAKRVINCGFQLV